MARVKIFLEDDETIEEAEESLLKALSSQSNGDAHANDVFEDPAMVEASKFMEKKFEKLWDSLLKDVEKLIDKEIK